MTDQRQQDPRTQSPPGGIERAQSLAGASAEWQRQKWHHKQEKEWEGNLRSLQQCICELLIKNQQLRESLMLTTNHQGQEFAAENDQSVARS